MLHNRRRGDRRRRLLWVFGLVAAFYMAIFVWPTAWRYHQVGRTPLRTNRVTGQVEYLNLQGWQPVMPPTDVGDSQRRPPMPAAEDTASAAADPSTVPPAP